MVFSGTGCEDEKPNRAGSTMVQCWDSVNTVMKILVPQT